MNVRAHGCLKVLVSHPGLDSGDGASATSFLSKIEKGELRRDELIAGYASLVYAKLGSYRATAERLGIDWRTVKTLVD